MSWRLTVRNGPRVERLKFDDADAAVDELEARARQFMRAAPNESVGGRVKRFEPVQQVFARLELAGPQRLLPSVRAGLDVRGDGSTESYRGRIRRELIEPSKGETAFAALRRTISSR